MNIYFCTSYEKKTGLSSSLRGIYDDILVSGFQTMRSGSKHMEVTGRKMVDVNEDFETVS